MLEKIKAVFRKPTPMERAAKELGNIEHSMLDAGAEITWALKRMEYYRERKDELNSYLQGEAK